jgi:hypothetical protein
MVLPTPTFLMNLSTEPGEIVCEMPKRIMNCTPEEGRSRKTQDKME